MGCKYDHFTNNWLSLNNEFFCLETVSMPYIYVCMLTLSLEVTLVVSSVV